MKRLAFLIILLSFTLSFGISVHNQARAASNADWQSLARYEYGQDLKPLLAIDREVSEAMTSPAKRLACLKRLVDLLDDPKTTLPAKQIICFKLQTMGTPSEVPLLTKMLVNQDTSEMARKALKKIPGDASLVALQNGLKHAKGKSRLGLINSLGVRKDASSVEVLKGLVDSDDSAAANAAMKALAWIGGDEVLEILTDKVADSPTPVPSSLAAAYLQVGWQLAKNGKHDEAMVIFEKMSDPNETTPSRQSALRGILDCTKNDPLRTTFAWLSDGDPLKRQAAAEKLNATQIDDATTKLLLEKYPAMPVDGKSILIDILAAKQIEAARPAIMAAAQGKEPQLKLAALRAMGTIGDTECVPILMDAYLQLQKTPYADAAKQSLITIPGQAVDRALLAMMRKEQDLAAAVGIMELLTRRRATLHVADVLPIVADKRPEVYSPVVHTMRKLAPANEVAPLIDLLPKISDRKHREAIEKTIFAIGQKRGRKTVLDAIWASFDNANQTDRAILLPLLGRFGGEKVLGVINKVLESKDSGLKEAALRALCNWPDASVSERLLQLAKTSKEPSWRTWALRAYIRVVTLPSKRPELETLAMLQEAMQLADSDSERRLAIQRASTVRTIETLRWVVPYLDDPALNQAACQTVLELAHHRFLLTANKMEFKSALQKVRKVSKDFNTNRLAAQYLTGL